jgi:hypothetical protein
MNRFKLISSAAFLLLAIFATAQNPLITNQFTADPTARVFNGKVYVFPSHDIPTPPEKPGRKDWFCMADYHVFSSENLTDWTDHGTIVSQNKVKWVDSTSYSMWAPDCIERNGKFYFYFPANTNVADAKGRKGFGIGVAIAEKPEGPYKALPEPIKGVAGIDPNVFIDRDGQAYLYWALGKIFVAKLKDNMTELASEPQVIDNLPQKGLIEGPFLFERQGIYYLTIPHVENKVERLEYAMGNSPVGPFKMSGVIMDESPVNCWTNHQSMVNYRNQWYLFYHHNDLSPKFDKNRSIRADSLFFNADGTIRKVIPTLRGVGISSAKSNLQVDRYSAISEKGVFTEFVDSTATFKGWKLIFKQENAWARFNKVDLGNQKLKKALINAQSVAGASFEIRLKGLNGPILATGKLDASRDLKVSAAKLNKYKSGVYDLFLISKSPETFAIDWLKFE